MLPDGSLLIGALVRNSDLALDPDFARDYPAVAEALLSGASPQLRNAATVGGNLLQRTRCAYFYDVASACNKRAPGSGCDARGGENRLHAVLGWSESCIATHPVRFLRPARRARRRRRDRRARTGRREIPLEELPSPAGRPAGARDACSNPGELIVARPPARRARRPSRAHARYLKLRERTSFAFAVVSAAAALRPRRRQDRRGADRARRRRARSLGARGRRKRRSRASRADAAASAQRPRAALARRDALGRQRLQDRAGAPHREARA